MMQNATLENRDREKNHEGFQEQETSVHTVYYVSLPFIHIQMAIKYVRGSDGVVVVKGCQRRVR